MASKAASHSLFEDVVQPESLSLFSSASSKPFALWTLHQDPDLEEDSGIRLLVDSTDEIAPSDQSDTSPSFMLRSDQPARGSSSETVLHIQSPAIRNTFIRSPPDKDTDLGIKLPYMTFQLRAIGGSRPFLIEIGIRDDQRRGATIRISSFQIEPKLYLKRHQSGKDQNISRQKNPDTVKTILHLPLTMAAQPAQDETSLTAWQVLTLSLDRLAEHCSDTSLMGEHEAAQEIVARLERFGSFEAVTYVKVHANMRLRRVWCSKQLPDHDLAEFQIFS